MRTILWSSVLVLMAALAVVPQPGAAQQPAPAQPAPAPQPGPNIVPAQEPSLVFEREVFTYPGSGRRDPFQPLTGENAGPLFEDLRLRIILFSDNPNESIVTLVDASGNRYRVRRGESVGNATIIDIGPTRVIFSIDDFGIRRQEVLELTATREGAGQ